MDTQAIGPHGATLATLEDCEEERNSLYRLTDADGNTVTLTGEELQALREA